MTTTDTPRDVEGLDETQAKMLERIRKLLAKAEHKNTTTIEAEAFTAMAAKLMRQYRIDRAMVELGTSKVVDLGTVLRRGVKVTPPYAKESVSLLAVVAGYVGCRTILETVTDAKIPWRKGVWVAVYGIDTDPELAEMLFTSLRIQATNGMLVSTARQGEDLATFRASWMRGFNDALNLRFAEVLAAARAAEGAVRTGAADLALRNRRDTVDAFIQAKYPSLGSVSSGKCSGSGRGAGYRAGQSADIGTGGVGSGPSGDRLALPA